MLTKGNQLDPESKQLQAEVDDLVRRWSGGDEIEYLRRWRQLTSWGLNRTQGEATKKAALKKRLMMQTGGACRDCGTIFSAASLQMHRLDLAYALDRSTNFGYFENNVVLICPSCHEQREAQRRAANEV